MGTRLKTGKPKRDRSGCWLFALAAVCFAGAASALLTPVRRES